MPGRTFVVTVTEAPARVVVEDVRSRRRAIASNLDEIGAQIERLTAAESLEAPANPPLEEETGE